ncbi:MAG TPA: DUF6348 family protein [Phycisphaerae bacterium]|jgi:hypothetical protein|nr:DUF6348 family protein [Phycisphaerae bacterium]
MSSTFDPNELAPLTELANRVVQERVRKIPEFATSSKWGVAAIVLQLDEGHGFFVRMGIELRTPLGDPCQDIVLGWGGNREDATRAAALEWLELALPAALAMHSDKDPHARIGETQKGGAVYSWRLAQGILWVKGPDADDVKKELGASHLFERLGMAAALPLERDVPWFCVKIGLARGEDGTTAHTALLNNDPWVGGLELLRRFQLPGARELEVKQYLFIRQLGKRAAAASQPAVPKGKPSAISAPAGGKKPWWKVW